MEIGFRLFFRGPFNGSLDPHLTIQPWPIKEQGSDRFFGELPTFFRIVVGEKQKLLVFVFLQQYHPIGDFNTIGGGKGHGIGLNPIDGAFLNRLSEPLVELLQRVGEQIR